MHETPPSRHALPKPIWDGRELKASLESRLARKSHGFKRTAPDVMAMHQVFGQHLWDKGIWVESILCQTFHCDLYKVTYANARQGILKILTRGRAGFHQRFEKEIQILRHLRGMVGVVQVICWSSFQENPYHLCGTVRGTPLERYCWNGGPHATRTKVTLILNTAEILCNLYDRDIVHRDVAPDHIFICDHQITLIDFGMASILSNCTAEQRHNYLNNDLSNLGFTLVQMLLEDVRFPFGNPSALAQTWLTEKQRLSQRGFPKAIVSLADRLIRCNREIPLPKGPTLASMKDAAARFKAYLDD